MTDIEKGYLDTVDTGYLGGPYLGGEYQDAWGMQVNMVVNKQVAQGQQAKLVINKQVAQGQQIKMIASSQKVIGQQILMQVVNKIYAKGMQVNSHLSTSKIIGMQVQQTISDSNSYGQQSNMILSNPTTIGMQVKSQIVDSSSLGMSVKADTLRHALCGMYLEQPYMQEAYLAECMNAFMGMQVQVSVLDEPFPIGMQTKMVINDDKAIGQQTNMIVNKQNNHGQQAKMILSRQVPIGMQTKMVVNDEKAIGQQTKMIVTKSVNYGMQIQQVIADKIGMQATMVIYNATQLRLMCDFPSRGVQALLGNNWIASTTAPGDYLPKNLNTDIIEQKWRSTTGTASLSTLTCDTGVVQGVPIDTIAILGHNLTRSASVQVQGSNDNFVTPPNIIFNMNTELENMYYISPTFPPVAGQNRYWRFIFQDVTNSAGFIEVGTLLFGTSNIFSIAECFSNPVVNGYKHFKDELRTEGFTNASNDRALKKFLKLDFEKLNYFKGNFRILDDSVKYARTSLKCLIIPTPQYPSRFAVFAKLASMPELTHTDIDATTGYVDLSLEWDESL